MAINNSYPEIEALASGDLFVVTDISKKNATKSIKAGSLSNYIRTTVSLQDVLNVNNTATQDIILTGEINTTDVITTSLIVDGTSELNGAVTLQSANILNSLSVNGDADFQTASFNNNVIFYNPTIFEDTILVPDIQFANPAVSGEKGLTWNNTDGTLDLGLKGGNVTLQIGQEEVALVVNKTGIDLLEADFRVVKVLGAQGQRLSVGLAQADNDINSATTLGVVTETILNNAEGFITTVGMVNNINATGAKSFGGLETWNDGDVLYLDPVNAGYMTNIKPITPAHLITIGYVVNAANNGKIYVKIDNGYELDELHDVKITTPTADQLLAYSASEGFWKNVDLSQISDSVTTASPGIGNYVTKFNSSSTISPSTLIFDDGIGVGIGTTTINEILNVEGKLALNNSTNSISIGKVTGGTGLTSVAVGSNALSVSTGSNNIAVGYGAMQNNIIGNRNVSIGYRSLLSNLTNSDNVAVGHQALLNSSSASYNTAIGSFSSENIVSGQWNSALGQQSLQFNTTGTRNSAFGSFALKSNTSGSDNVAIGEQALLNNTTGSGNTCIGTQAGKLINGGAANTISFSSIFIGLDSRPLANNEVNQIVIGNTTIGNGSNTTTIGNSSQTSLYFGGNGAGLVLKSPNGTKYKITVDNSGNLVTTAI